MAEDEVGETIEEAKETHAEKAEDPGATTGQAQEPAEEGYAEPDTGGGDAPESDIPVGVDQLTDEQIAKAEEAGPAAGSGDEGDGGALDVSALMEEGGADDADAGEPTADDDTAGPDAAEEEA
jgi:hypothetical protein